MYFSELNIRLVKFTIVQVNYFRTAIYLIDNELIKFYVKKRDFDRSLKGFNKKS